METGNKKIPLGRKKIKKMKLFNSSMHVFWQALIISVIIFNLGIFLGYMLENSRIGKVNQLYAESELNLLDVKIQSEMYDSSAVNCENAIEGNIAFADKVYEEAKILDKFESASRMTDSIRLQHEKYDLLRTLFWLNSMKIKQKCNASYHDVVYFYQYNDATLEIKAEQNVFSRLLGDLKVKYGNSIMLIPIAADNNVSSVSMLLKAYNVTEFPTVLIDEKTKITQLETVKELEKYID